MQPIILASQSKNRQLVLKSLGVPFKTIVSNFNEHSVKEKRYSSRAKKIALGKALLVAEKQKGIIISADTFTVFKDEIMEKPKTKKKAEKMLQSLSENKAVSYTGFAFINNQDNFMSNQTVKTEITFRKINTIEVKRIAQKYPVTTWAGGYALINLYLFSLVKDISGSLTGLTHGLPTELLVPLLKKYHYQIKIMKQLPY